MHLFQIKSFLTGLVLMLVPAVAFSASVNLRWKANSEPDFSSYNLYYGTKSRNYAPPIPVGKATSYSVDHLTEGVTYYFAVTAIDTSGNESGYSEEDTAKATPSSQSTGDSSSFNLEIGEVNVDHNWTKVTFQNKYTKPVVVATSMSHNGSDPAVVRMRNITPDGFEIAVQEYSYLDGLHTVESIGYIVLEKGHHVLPDGSRLEAGYTTHSQTDVWKKVDFKQPFSTKPVVFTSITTFNGRQPVLCRKKKITTSGFKIAFQEEQARGNHKSEKVSYVAVESGVRSVSGITLEAVNTGEVISHEFKSIQFRRSYPTIPSFIGDIQTFNGEDTASIRWTNMTNQEISLKIEEEKSHDSETNHTFEEVGYLVLLRN